MMHVDELMHVRRRTVVTANLLSKVTLLFSEEQEERDRKERAV